MKDRFEFDLEEYERRGRYLDELDRINNQTILFSKIAIAIGVAAIGINAIAIIARMLAMK